METLCSRGQLAVHDPREPRRHEEDVQPYADSRPNTEPSDSVCVEERKVESDVYHKYRGPGDRDKSEFSQRKKRTHEDFVDADRAEAQTVCHEHARCHVATVLAESSTL